MINDYTKLQHSFYMAFLPHLSPISQRFAGSNFLIRYSINTLTLTLVIKEAIHPINDERF